MPPKAVPMSMPARAVKNRAMEKSATRGDHVGGGRQRQVRREHGNDPARQDRHAEDEVRREPEYPGGVLGQHNVLGEQLQEVPVGLEQARRRPALGPALHHLHPPREERRGKEKDGPPERPL